MLSAAAEAAEARERADALAAEGSQNFAAVRRELGMSQSDLVAATGVSASYISMIESGERVATPSTLQTLYGAMDSYVTEGGADARDKAKADAKKARGQ